MRIEFFVSDAYKYISVRLRRSLIFLFLSAPSRFSNTFYIQLINLISTFQLYYSTLATFHHYRFPANSHIDHYSSPQRYPTTIIATTVQHQYEKHIFRAMIIDLPSPQALQSSFAPSVPAFASLLGVRVLNETAAVYSCSLRPARAVKQAAV